MLQEIKINPQYKSLVPELSAKEYRELKESIRHNGLWHPITINKDGYILDGHHRFKACTELNNQAQTTVYQLDDPLLEKLFVIDSNLTRRQLSEFARIELALIKKPILQEIAKRNMSLGGKGVRIQTPLGRIDQKIADSAQSTKGMVRNVEKLLTTANLDAETLSRLRQGRAKISAEVFRFDKALRVQDAQAKAIINHNNSPNKNEMFDLKHGDMIEMGKQIADNSIDMIFTDPPYKVEYLPLYGELAKLAVRVLKPGGSLVFFMGHFHEDEIEQLIGNNSELVFNHRFIVLHTGHIKSLTRQRIWAYYKPLMHYYKLKENGKRPDPFHDIADIIRSEAVPKDDHEWEQSTKEALHMIEPLTVEKELVLDPFMGSGTIGLAALQLKRRFIGIEIDKDSFITAKAKLTKASADQLGIPSPMLRTT